MRLKKKCFMRLVPWSGYYRVVKFLAVAQLLISIAIPLAMPHLNTGYWFLSFMLFIFWLSSYALLRLVHHHQADASGVRGWFSQQWENVLFISWLLIALLTVLLSIKLALFGLNI